MTSTLDGPPDAAGLRGVLVVSRFNEFVTSKLLSGAREALHDCRSEEPTVLHVPGAWEIPLAVDRALASGRYDFAVALGVLIRGQTYHFDVLADTVARALSEVSRARGLPVSMGVLTVESVEQAIERSGSGSANKGREAALAAIDMARLLKTVE
ncbi:MAG: 6,7-dimethyl-8-ribityllumazine synthase [Acidobacteria bacterium]|nr:6,7-dimethyl-8-ribityllumazine synthase [Acidobacteriota bacterium]NIM63130.1 6,7-dimethyl-8-ribityllumazine synthase [Acidobacteriota bacterium]NIO58397.1 6,7-dimethyl-8-ribityllumazine synthase [Acidobacteriota bacterium]NIQ29444.1 6,7-dimethyl-8-ribityllumazine synthase [Acidobacteriota bacterium]NIQ84096.1 6,7-dimethyl-8-ribityllumazine synthase [Acidobacteriota bacterium]